MLSRTRRLPVTLRSSWPLLGVTLSLALFHLAATSYPGGTTDSATSAGYDWGHNFISSLFAVSAR